MTDIVDKSKPYFPLAGSANDGWSKEDEATATCFCGAVQLAFVSLAPEPGCKNETYLCAPFSPPPLSPSSQIHLSPLL